MGRRANSIPADLRARILERDNNRCVKCGRRKGLEIHHIFPCYQGGTDAEFNLITLCGDCHDHSPDNPIEFIKYCSHHLPDEFYRSSQITKLITCIILADLRVYEFGTDRPVHTLDDYLQWRDADVQNMERRFALVDERVDELYPLLWKVFLDGDTDQLCKFLNLLSGSRRHTGIDTPATSELSATEPARSRPGSCLPAR